MPATRRASRPSESAPRRSQGATHDAVPVRKVQFGDNEEDGDDQKQASALEVEYDAEQTKTAIAETRSYVHSDYLCDS